jgi:transcriptional regulator with XRE-family HTH domain
MFKEKLNQAMVDLKLSQSKLCELTGIGKSSISQYLSGKNVPTEDRQREMAEALGLNSNYFEEELENKESVSYTTIKKLLPEQAGKLMGISKDTVRKGLQDGTFPWGYAVKTSPNRWTYFINAQKFSEIEGIDLGFKKE